MYIGPPGTPGGPTQQFPQPGPPPGGAPDQYGETLNWQHEPRPAQPYPGSEDPFGEAGWYRQSGRAQAGQEAWFRDQGEPYPGGAGRGPGPATRRDGKRLVLAATVVTVILAAIIVGVVLSRGKGGHPSSSLQPSGSPSPSAASGASGQAAAINKVLSSSAAARRSLPGAVTSMLQCKNVSGAVSQMKGVVNQRQSEVNQASALSVSALQNGAAVKSDLLAALHSSLTADQDYLSWAQQESSGCKPGARNGTYQAAISADSQAVNAKKAFVGVWNPVANATGLPQQSATTF